LLATRIMATLLIRDNQLVKGKNFVNDRRIGSIQEIVNVMQKREIDEMIILDVDATKENRLIDYNIIRELTSDCFMPLGFGGGIKSIADIELLLENGADKVIIGTAWKESKGFKLIEDAAKKFGSQAICIAYNYNKVSFNENAWNYYSDAIDQLEQIGAGEIILNCITNDGTMQGYDIDFLEYMSENKSIPIIASGGAGCYEDFYQAIHAGAHAVSAGAMWAFTEQTPKKAKEYLRTKGITCR
jgi:imidazole glycerol-phosphate synthase subunit HisF